MGDEFFSEGDTNFLVNYFESNKFVIFILNKMAYSLNS